MTTSVVQHLRGLLAWLVARPIKPLSSRAVVLWWEARRVPYNAIVGVVGLASSTIMVAVAFTCESRGGAPIGLPDPPAFAIVGVLLYDNLPDGGYMGDWMTELHHGHGW